jgi:hypothetical protein
MRSRVSQTQAEERDVQLPGRSTGNDAALAQGEPDSSSKSGRYHRVISTERRVFLPLIMVAVILLMFEVVSTQSIWIFAPFYVGVVLLYVAGCLYMVKKLLTYSPYSSSE